VGHGEIFLQDFRKAGGVMGRDEGARETVENPIPSSDVEFGFATIILAKETIILAKAMIQTPAQDGPNRFWILAFARTTAAISNRGCTESLASRNPARGFNR